MTRKKRSVGSIKQELIKKSKEAALAAIQIFNNPMITFKSESFIVLMNIAWTYLLHAYYREKNTDYRYYKIRNGRKVYEKTAKGATKHWELEKCLSATNCPLEQPVRDNLLFLIGIRHEIEHQMTKKIDDFISAKFQACCINYNKTLKELFGKLNALDKVAPISLQLFSFQEEQFKQLKSATDLPKNILEFVSDFESGIQTKDSPQYSYRVIYLRDNVNHESQADKAYRFLDEASSEGKEIHNILIKNKKLKKLKEGEVIDIINTKGFTNFDKNAHQEFWKHKWATANERNNNEEAKKYGEVVMNNIWMWYEDTWIPEIINYLNRQENTNANN